MRLDGDGAVGAQHLHQLGDEEDGVEEILLVVAGALEDLGDAAAKLLQLLHGIAGDDGAGGGAADDQHLVRQGVHDGAEVSPGDEETPEHHRSEEHTSELQSLMRTSYAVFCLKKKKQINNQE